MSGRRRVKIHSVKRLLDDFFKIDRFWVSYQLYDKDDERNPKKSDEKKEGGTILEYLKADPIPDVKPEEASSDDDIHEDGRVRRLRGKSTDGALKG